MALYIINCRSKKFSFKVAWKIVLELMTGNVVISVVDVLMYVVLSKAENTFLMGD